MENFVIYSAAAAVALLWIYNWLLSGDTLDARGIPNDKPLPLVGNGLALIFQRVSVIDYFENMYKRFAGEKLFGFTAFFGRYTIVIKDPEMLKKVAITDFDHFVNRDPFEHTEADKYLSKSLILLRDQKWKDMRATISPVFTSSKLKFMYGLLSDTIEDFVNFHEDEAKRNSGIVVIDTHDAFARITVDGIATTTLGFKGDCVRNKDSKIYEIAYALEDDFTNQSNFLVTFLPRLYKFLDKQICRKSVHEFFETNVLSEIKRRQTEKITRPDVIQLLIQAKQGKLKVEKADEGEVSYKQPYVQTSQWTDDDLVAQAVIMFLGGFETTAILMQAICHELSIHTDIQNTLINEVDKVQNNLNGRKISYEEVNGMKFLDQVISEALRKWPSFRITSRECTKEYVLKDDDTGKSYVIKKGAEIIFPIGALHNDPSYFRNPEKFDPSRFSDENKPKIIPGSYIPFGYGQRQCVGSRYATLDTKMMMFHILTKFSITTCPETPQKLELATGLAGFKSIIKVNLKLRK